MDKTILDFTEATDFADDDYIILDSESGGACRIRAKSIVPVVLGVEAIYTQTQEVTKDTPLDDLRQDLVVKAIYRNNRKKVVTDYTLSGTLAVGTSTITVTYSGFTTTFNVEVSSDINYLYNWDFTQSLYDKVQNEPAILSGTGIYQTANGIQINSMDGYITLTSSPLFVAGKTYEIDFGDMTPSFSSHVYLIRVSVAGRGFLYHTSRGWCANDGGMNYNTEGTQIFDKEIFKNKTLKAICTSSKFYVYAVDKENETEIEVFNARNCVDSNSQMLNIGWGYYNMIVKGVRIYNNM